MFPKVGVKPWTYRVLRVSQARCEPGFRLFISGRPTTNEGRNMIQSRSHDIKSSSPANLVREKAVEACRSTPSAERCTTRRTPVRSQARNSAAIPSLCTPAQNRRTVLQYAGTVHDRIDAAQVRQPLRRIDCARDVDRHLSRDQEVRTPTAPSGDTNHLVALRSKARCHGRSNQSIHPDDENAHLGLLRDPRDALFQHWPRHFLVPHVGR